MIARFVSGPLDEEVEAALARLERAPGVARIAVMPDVHLAAEVCVGTVVATHDQLYPAAVGGDIGCGVAALRFDVPADALADAARAARVLALLYERIPRERHRRAELPAWEAGELSAPRLSALARHDGRAQLGTLGSGNHFVELQRDEAGALWVMLHSGSRGMGPAIRAHHEQQVGGLAALPADDARGRAYLADLEWALRYADASRALMVAAVAETLGEVLGAQPVPGSAISCHHNHVRRELHDGEWLWVHRKGAIPAALDQPGVIPGSMGAPSFHVAGRGCAAGLASSSHGAGRAMSRGEARRRISVRALHQQLAGVWFDHRRADALRDEAPAAYKDIGAVMRAQRELTRVVRRLEPVLCFKGG